MGGYHGFPSELSYRKVPKKFVGEPFGASKNIGYRKILCLGKGYLSFWLSFFVSQCRRFSWGTILCFKKLLLWKKLGIGREGVSRFCVGSFWSIGAENI